MVECNSSMHAWGHYSSLLLEMSACPRPSHGPAPPDPPRGISAHNNIPTAAPSDDLSHIVVVVHSTGVCMCSTTSLQRVISQRRTSTCTGRGRCPLIDWVMFLGPWDGYASYSLPPDMFTLCAHFRWTLRWNQGLHGRVTAWRRAGFAVAFLVGSACSAGFLSSGMNGKEDATSTSRETLGRRGRDSQCCKAPDLCIECFS